MTKQELIDLVAKEAGLETKAVAKKAVEATFEAIAGTLKKEGRFLVPSFGTFSVRERAAREGKNPKTGEAIKIAASKTVGFKPAPCVKEMLNAKKCCKKK